MMFILTYLFYTTIALLSSQVFSFSPLNYNRCTYNKQSLEVECTNQNLTTSTHGICSNEFHLKDELEEPFYANFELNSTDEIYISKFFKMYHPKKFKNKDFSKLSNTIKGIADKIQQKYYNISQYDRAQLMINELTRIQVYDDIKRKEVLLFDESESSVKINDAFCNAQNYNQYVYPVITVGEGKRWRQWMLNLNFGGPMNQTMYNVTDEHIDKLRHEFLLYVDKTSYNNEEKRKKQKKRSKGTVAKRFVTESSTNDLKQPVVITEDSANIDNLGDKKND